MLDAHVRAKGEEGGARCPAFHQMAELMNDGLVKYRARKHEYLQLMRAANDGKLSRVSLYDKRRDLSRPEMRTRGARSSSPSCLSSAGGKGC